MPRRTAKCTGARITGLWVGEADSHGPPYKIQFTKPSFTCLLRSKLHIMTGWSEHRSAWSIHDLKKTHIYSSFPQSLRLISDQNYAKFRKRNILRTFAHFYPLKQLQWSPNVISIIVAGKFGPTPYIIAAHFIYLPVELHNLHNEHQHSVMYLEKMVSAHSCHPILQWQWAM